MRALAGSSLTATNLMVVTNTSQQNLLGLFTSLPEYPNPAAYDAATYQAALDAYAIANPAAGLSFVSSAANLAGSTSIRSGGGAVVLDGATAVAHLNGTLSIQAGPGGDATTSIVAINAIRGAQLTASGEISMQVDSVGGGGVRSSSASAVTLDVRATGNPLRITMVNPMNAPSAVIDASETAALHPVGGAITVLGDALFESYQARGYGLWNHDLPASRIVMDGNTTIRTHGREAIGVRLDDGSMRLSGDLTIVTGLNPSNADAQNGSGAIGIRGIVGTLQVSGSTSIETHGATSIAGVDHVHESGFGILNSSVSRQLNGSAALTFVGPVQIRTSGNGAHGVYNDSAAGTIEFAAPVQVTTSGSTDSVTWQRDANNKPINESIGAWGVNSALSGTTTFKSGLSVTTTGDNSGGVRSAGGLVDMQGGATVTTSGAAAHGLYATSAGDSMAGSKRPSCSTSTLRELARTPSSPTKVAAFRLQEALACA